MNHLKSKSWQNWQAWVITLLWYQRKEWPRNKKMQPKPFCWLIAHVLINVDPWKSTWASVKDVDTGYIHLQNQSESGSLYKRVQYSVLNNCFDYSFCVGIVSLQFCWVLLPISLISIGLNVTHEVGWLSLTCHIKFDLGLSKMDESRAFTLFCVMLLDSDVDI